MLVVGVVAALPRARRRALRRRSVFFDAIALGRSLAAVNALDVAARTVGTGRTRW